MKTILNGAHKDQKGAAFAMVLVLLVLGGLVLTPLLGLMSTGLMSGQVYENSMRVLYAADAGIDDAMWQLWNEQLPVLFPDYDEYDYADQWSYPLDNHEGEDGGVAQVVLVNDKSVVVAIENVWIPEGILASDAPDATTARQIIEEGNLIIAGSASVTQSSTYEIKVTAICGDPAITSVGIWLPPGFEYVMGSSDLEKATTQPYHSIPDVFTHMGGYAVVWDFDPPVSISGFPESFAFKYSGPAGEIPGAAVSWIDTSEGYTWDADVRVYKVTSTATDPDTGKQMSVESYTSSVEPRKLGSAVSGDYHATGATLMTPTTNSYYRSRLFKQSSATVSASDIPSNARIDAAWLYWSGWIETAPGDLTVFYDDCYDFNAPAMLWNAGSAWTIYAGSSYDREFRGNAYYTVGPGERILIWGTETCGDFIHPPMNWGADSAWNIYNAEFRGSTYYQPPAGEWQSIWGTENCENFVAPVMNWEAQSAWDAYYGEFRGNNYYEAPTGEWQTIWGTENCENFVEPIMNWDAQSAWDISSARFRGNNYYEPPTGEWQSIWGPETCEDLAYPVMNWNAGSAWGTSSGRFRGRTYYSTPESAKYISMSSSVNLSAYAGQTVRLSWQQSEEGYLGSSDCLYFSLSGDGGSTWSSNIRAFCDDIGSTPQTYAYNLTSSYVTNNFRVRFYVSGFTDSGEYCYVDNVQISRFVVPPSQPAGSYLTMNSSIDLSAHAGQTVRVSWQQDEDGYLSDDDRLYFAFSANGGSTWSANTEAFRNDDPAGSFTYTIPSQYLTNNFRMRFYVSGFTDSSEYCYVDSVQISALAVPPYEPGSYLTMGSSIDLSAHAAETVRIAWQQDEGGYLSDDDRLYFAFSANGGSTWSANIEAFRNDDPPGSFTYNIPSQYLTNNFRMRFYVSGFTDSSEYCFIDNIGISAFVVPPYEPPPGYLTMLNSIALSAYAGQTVEVTWQQHEDGSLEGSGEGLDCLYYSFSKDNGLTWSSDTAAFCGNIGTTRVTYTATIPAGFLTNTFRMRFHLGGFADYDERCYIDNIEIATYATPSEPPGRYLTMGSSLDLSGYAGQTVEISWQQRESGDLEDSDRLYFAFSSDGGIIWSADIEAFRNDNPLGSFSYAIPSAYLTDNFKMRFYLYGFEEGGYYTTEYCYIDDITITAQLPLVETAKVNRVEFGSPFNMYEITAERSQTKPTPDSGAPDSWSYSCYRDVTDIVRAGLDPDTNSGTFTLGHVLEGSGYTLYDPLTGTPAGTTGYPLATPALSTSTRYQWTYAGWSLLIIYSSPETKGHQLYLFDTFRYVGLDTRLTFAITNFLAPDDTTGSHLTYFVGEGDNHYTTDYIMVNGYQLPLPGDPYEDPPVNPQNNVFNSYSNSLDDPYLSGVDIDTFDVSACIQPADSTAEVILDNGQEIYNLVYIILSFRSLVTSGGVMGYLIRG